MVWSIIMPLAMARCLTATVSLTTLSPFIVLTLSSPTKVRMVFPTHIVGVGVRVILDVCDSFYVKQACIDGVRFAASYIVGKRSKARRSRINIIISNPRM